MSACHFCGASLEPKMRIVRDTSCPKCGRDLHACVQCRHYDRHAHNQCREPNAEWVTDREKAARSKLDSLFSKPAPDPEDSEDE